MEFEYEITADDYAAGAFLFWKRSFRKRQGIGWFVAGLVLLVVGVIEKEKGLSPVLLGAIGVWLLCVGIAWIFPGERYRRRLRKHYGTLDLAGQKYRATILEGGFEVAGITTSWRYTWPMVKDRGENEKVFMFYAGQTLFIFAKRYLPEEKQQELRSLAGLKSLQ